MHPEARSPAADLDNLRRKLDAGATRAITQFFFDNADFFRFRERAAAVGITAPITPGIMPVTNCARIERFARTCGASFPESLREAFEGLDDDPAARRKVAADLATDQCEDLLAEGVQHLHFYTLNRADLTSDICARIGAGPSADGGGAVAP